MLDLSLGFFVGLLDLLVPHISVAHPLATAIWRAAFLCHAAGSIIVGSIIPVIPVHGLWVTNKVMLHFLLITHMLDKANHAQSGNCHNRMAQYHIK